MSPKFFADSDSKISKLKKDGSYSVQNRSGLSLIKRSQSLYFEGKYRNQSVAVGVWKKDVTTAEAIAKWNEIKSWSKTNNRNPKFYTAVLEECPKTLQDVAQEYFEEVYKPKTKERTWRDRENKLNQMLQHFGKDELITDFELEKGGREKIKKMLKDVFESQEHHYQLVRCRQLLTWIFNYAEDELYIRPNQNPVFKRFLWEGLKHQKKGSPTLAKTITSKSWGDVPRFLQSVNENACNGSKITDLAVKAHLLLCIRTGVVVRLEWDWFDEDRNLWVIPAQTPGLKRKKGDAESIHHIPSTPELKHLFDQLREITGWQKYVFYSFNGKNYPHLGEETINDHLKNLNWEGKQSAHGWRDVITTATLEHSTFEYDILDRQLGRLAHKQGTRGHYDESTLLDKRRSFMEWWSAQLIQQGLKISPIKKTIPTERDGL